MLVWAAAADQRYDPGPAHLFAGWQPVLVPTAVGVFLHAAESLGQRIVIPGPCYRGFAAISPYNRCWLPSRLITSR